MRAPHFQTRIGKTLGIFTQAVPLVFQVFFHFGFGRRQLTLWRGVILPAAILSAAALVRRDVFEKDFSEQDAGCFMLLILLFLAFALGHWIHLRIAIMRGTDAASSYSWGTPWLSFVPVLGPSPIVEILIEPALLFCAGLLLHGTAPYFAGYLITGALVLCIEQTAVSRAIKNREIDAQDALFRGEVEQANYEAAQAHRARGAQANGAISGRTLARVQKNPHALLTLSPEQTRAACEALGPDDFGDLVDRLPAAAQDTVYGRLAGLSRA